MMTMPNEEGLEKDSINATMVRSDSRGNDVRTVAITDEGHQQGFCKSAFMVMRTAYLQKMPTGRPQKDDRSL